MVILSTSNDVIDLASAITDYGVLVVIAAVFLVIVVMYLTTIMKRDSKTVSGIIPKMDELSKNLVEFQRVFNEVLSAHSAHSNQSLKSLERDENELREILLGCQKTLTKIEGEMEILRSNYDTLFKTIIETRQNNYNHNSQKEYAKMYCRTDMIEDAKYTEVLSENKK